MVSKEGTLSGPDRCVSGLQCGWQPVSDGRVALGETYGCGERQCCLLGLCCPFSTHRALRS